MNQKLKFIIFQIFNQSKMEIEEIKPETPESQKPSYVDYLKKFSLHSALASFWAGQFFVWLALTAVVWPEQVQQIVGNERKELFLGILMLPSSLVNMIIPPISGLISDRSTLKLGRRRPLMILGTIISVIFCFFCAIFTFPWKIGSFEIGFLFLMIAACGLSFGLSISAGSFAGLMPDVVQVKEQGLASGSLGVGRSVGNLFGVVCGGLFLIEIPSPYGIYSTYILCFLVLMVVLLYCGIVIKEVPQQDVEKFSFKDLKTFYLPTKVYRDFYLVFFSRFCFEMGIFGLISYILYLLYDIFNVQNPQMNNTLIITIMLISSIIVSPIAGYLSDKYGRKPLIYVSVGFTSLSFYTLSILALFKAPVALFYILSVPLGIGMGIFYAVDWALVLDVLPTFDFIAKDIGLWHISSSFPTLVAPFITGVLIDAIKRNLNINIAWSVNLLICGIWITLSAVLILFVSKKSPGNDNNKLERNASIKVDQALSEVPIEEYEKHHKVEESMIDQELTNMVLKDEEMM